MYYRNTLQCRDTIYIILKLLKGGRRPSSVGDYSLGDTAAAKPYTAAYRPIPPYTAAILFNITLVMRTLLSLWLLI